MTDALSLIFDVLGSDAVYYAVIAGAVVYIISKKTTLFDKYKWLWTGKKNPLNKMKIAGYDRKSKTLYLESPEPAPEDAEEATVVKVPSKKTKDTNSTKKESKINLSGIFHQSGCDCQCHKEESGILFCYNCSQDPKCTSSNGMSKGSTNHNEIEL